MNESQVILQLARILTETDASFREYRNQAAAREQAYANAYAEFAQLLGVKGNYVEIRNAIADMVATLAEAGIPLAEPVDV